jgi:myo-inositol-1(or 4)-monophosphatase
VTSREAPGGTTAPGALDTGSLLELACSAAVAAGERLARQHDRPVVVQTKTSPTDVVTQLDRAAEEQIRAHILAARPQDVILGEEGGQHGADPNPAGGAGADAGAPGADAGGGLDARVRWIVDPLDGTVNYLYGLPDWAVSIAAEVDGEVVAGAVFAPRRGALFSARRDGGAWARQGPPDAPPRRLACNSGVPLDRALVATGFGYAAVRRQVQGEVLAAVLPRVRDIRRGGSCAVDLCSLAGGHVDAYYERGVQAWDVAAGGLIAREAGAVVAGLDGRPAGPELTIAAAPGLFEQLHDLLLALRPERDALD